MSGINSSRVSSGKKRTFSQNSVINVTPLVDVMLVLLIIFMVTAPMMTEGIKIDLPKVKGEEIKNEDTPLVISIKSESEIFIGEKKIKINELKEKIKNLLNVNKDLKIYIKGNKSLKYELIMKIVSEIVAGGATNIALIVDGGNNSFMKECHF